MLIFCSTHYIIVGAIDGAQALAELNQALERTRQEELRAQQALAVARQATMDIEWALHEASAGAKTQVIAQYGPDSQVMQLLGLKRKSARRRPTRRTSATP
jgi:hypothetical protein